VRIRWTRLALSDVERLADFVAGVDPARADAVERKLIEAPLALRTFPRRGSRLPEFTPRDVREFRVDAYLLRYEVAGDNVFVLRIFHAREDRFG
jgi:plasmid stabilization system protein ParE